MARPRRGGATRCDQAGRAAGLGAGGLGAGGLGGWVWSGGAGGRGGLVVTARGHLDGHRSRATVTLTGAGREQGQQPGQPGTAPDDTPEQGPEVSMKKKHRNLPVENLHIHVQIYLPAQRCANKEVRGEGFTGVGLEGCDGAIATSGVGAMAPSRAQRGDGLWGSARMERWRGWLVPGMSGPRRDERYGGGSRPAGSYR